MALDSSLLKKIPIFKGLTPADLEKLEGIIEERAFAAGHELFHTGDQPDAFYVIKSGAVRIVNEEGGKETELATLREGDFFGEMGVMEGTPRMAGAILLEDGDLFEVEAHEFHRFMAINPAISRKIMSTMLNRYRVKAADTSTQGGGKREPGVVISVFSATGGVGNSLVISNTAAAIKKMTGKKVAVVDLDLMFGDQVGIFNVKGSNSLSAIVGESEIGMDTLDSIVEETAAGVDLIPAPLRPVEAESITPDLVRVVIEVLQGTYDYVLIDTANAVGETNLGLLEIVDRSFYLMTADFLAVKNARRWFQILDMINMDTSEIQVVINKEVASEESIRDEIEKTLSRKILATLPLDYRTAKKTLNSGELAVLTMPESRLAAGVNQLASALTGVEVPKQEEPKGFWARLGFGG